jgi:hypothetical protein
MKYEAYHSNIKIGDKYGINILDANTDKRLGKDEWIVDQ